MVKPTRHHICSLTIKQHYQVISLHTFKNLHFELLERVGIMGLSVMRQSQSAYPADLCTTTALLICKGICCGCAAICRAPVNTLLYKFIALGLQINWGDQSIYDGKAAIQQHLDRLGNKQKKWNGIHYGFSRTIIFCTGRKSPQCCTVGTAQPRSSSTEKKSQGSW